MELRTRCSSDVAAVKRIQDTTNRLIMNLKFAVFYFSEVIVRPARNIVYLSNRGIHIEPPLIHGYLYTIFVRKPWL